MIEPSNITDEATIMDMEYGCFLGERVRSTRSTVVLYVDFEFPKNYAFIDIIKNKAVTVVVFLLKCKGKHIHIYIYISYNITIVF